MPYLKLLGGALLEEEKGGEVLTGPGARRHPLALLALLAASESRTLSRTKIAGILWPDSDEESARNRLNTCVYRVRSTLDDETLRTVGSDLELDDEVLPSDVAEFERALEREDWEKAVEVYDGEFLDGFQLGGAAAFEKWVDEQRGRLRRRYLEALESLAEADVSRGEHASAARWWRRRATEDPYDSRVVVRLMEVLAQSGNPAEGLRVARVHTRLLKDELDASPAPEVEELARELRDEPRARGSDSPERPERESPVGADGGGREAGEGDHGAEVEGTPPSGPGRESRDRDSVDVQPTRSGPPLHAPRVAVTILVGVGLLGAALVGGWYLIGLGGEVPSGDRGTIAVLPFTSAGEQPAEVLTEGMYADVVARLSSVPGLEVVSGAAAERLLARNDSVPERGARRSASSWVLLGEIRQSGDQVRMRTRLLDRGEGRAVWTEEYRRAFTARGAFEIQEDVVREIVDELTSRLSLGEPGQLERAPPENLEAYRLYVQGRGLLKQRTRPEMFQAVDHFRRAIQADSGYALAWAGLADALTLLDGLYGGGDSVAVRMQGTGELAEVEALQAARRALEVNPQLAEAHASLGLQQLRRSEGPGAVRELQRAIRLRSSYADAHHWLSLVWLALGAPERAREQSGRAVKLDSLSPAIRVGHAAVLMVEGDRKAALREVRRSREIQPGYTAARIMEGVILYHLDRLEEARSVVGRLGEPDALALEGLIEARTGDKDAARAILDRLQEEGGRPFHSGLVLAALGQTDDAFSRLEPVERWAHLNTTLSYRYLFPEALGELRRDPRYAEILRALNRHWGLRTDGSLPRDRDS